MSDFLFGKGKKVHFLSYGENTSIEGKSNEAGIMVHFENGEFVVKYTEKHRFKLKPKKHDLYEEETFANIKHYFVTTEEENDAVQHNKKLQLQYLNEEISKEYYLKHFASTHRIKYCRLVKKEIRGKGRFFVQMVIEGKPTPKRKKDGSFRHKLGKGKTGLDFGTQTVAVVSKKQAELINLAENVQPIHEKIQKNQRKMDRSKRKNNPDYFHEDGRIKKGKKKWNYSNRYKKLKQKNKELHRKAAIQRKLAHQTLTNKLLSYGDEFYGEKMSFKGLQKRAKEIKANEKTGKIQSTKRYGKTIANKAPGMFVRLFQQKVENENGTFSFVNTTTFKASQYDHTTGKCNKKSLSERWHTLPNGTKIQRDMYSAFLLQNSHDDLKKPNQGLCEQTFESFKENHDAFLTHVVNHKIVIKNSGIKIK